MRKKSIMHEKGLRCRPAGSCALLELTDLNLLPPTIFLCIQRLALPTAAVRGYRSRVISPFTACTTAARRPAAIRAAVSTAKTKPSRTVIQVHSTAPLGAGVSSAFAEGPRLHSRCRRCHDVAGGVGCLIINV